MKTLPFPLTAEQFKKIEHFFLREYGDERHDLEKEASEIINSVDHTELRSMEMIVEHPSFRMIMNLIAMKGKWINKHDDFTLFPEYLKQLFNQIGEQMKILYPRKPKD